jgi:tetraacyldisaccharide 4'-kinase
MKQSMESRFRQVMSGSDRSGPAVVWRLLAAGAEPMYAGLMRLRNRLYDSQFFKSHPLGRPTISVGNITTGGTGKTPVVQWLSRRLLETGQRPAILLRGYKSTSHGVSDEQALLATDRIAVIADPNRRRGAAAALQKQPETTVFILDDAMQHRRAKRDFELTLIHAAQPFGFGRVFPRGLLREPMIGLRRAGAILLTHCDEGDDVASVVSTLRKFNPGAPVFQCDHVVRVAELAQKKYFAFCGIGSPASFLGRLGGTCVGTREFDDHHDYDEADIGQLVGAARFNGAEVLVTTEKDWVKLSRFEGKFPVPVLRAELSLRFHADDEARLLQVIRDALRF